jgi:hypothetical protein
MCPFNFRLYLELCCAGCTVVTQLKDWLYDSKPMFSTLQMFPLIRYSNVSSFLICYSCNHINVLQGILKSSRWSVWVIHHSSSTVSTRSPSFIYCLIQFIQWTLKYGKFFIACKMDVCISQNIVTKLFPWDCYYMDIPKSLVSGRHYWYHYSSASSSCQGLGLSNVIFRWSGYYHLDNPQTEGPGFSVRIYHIRRFGFTVPEVSLPLCCSHALSGSSVKVCPAWETLLSAMPPPTLSCTEAHAKPPPTPRCVVLLVWKSDMYGCVIELHRICF